MVARYKVTLMDEERELLESLTKKGKHNSRTVLLSRALMLCDIPPKGPGWSTKDICEALGLSARTVERMKKRFVEEGLDQALERNTKESSRREIKFDGAFEARLIALACSEPPKGRVRWTVRLLAEKAVELQIAESISTMTVQRVLKKTHLNLIKKNIGKSLRKGMPLL